MKYIVRIKDLEQFGIVPLTGEACGIGCRILCDLTERGRQIVADAYGLSTEGFYGNWNRGSEDDPHVASFMLSGFGWEQVGIIALLLHGGCHTVVHSLGDERRDPVLVGLEANDALRWSEERGYEVSRGGDPWVQWPDFQPHLGIGRIYRRQSYSTSNGRVQHAMSGRVV